MAVPRYEIILRGDHRREFTLEALAQRAGLHPMLVERFVDLQLIEPTFRDGSRLAFDASALVRVRTICRLRNALGVNCAGVAVILDLLDKLAAAQREPVFANQGR